MPSDPANPAQPFASASAGPSASPSSTPTPTPKRVMEAMLDRLFAAIMTGPSMNCRPHHSRQRIDLFAFNALQSLTPAEILQALLSADGKVVIDANVNAPAGMATGRWRNSKTVDTSSAQAIDPKTRDAWNAQQQVLSKLRIIAQEADTYEQDTGVYVLNLGFPLLSLPPGQGTVQGTPSTRRVLAPLAFMPIVVEITAGTTTRITLACGADDIDRVHPNESLLAWIEQSTGQPITLDFHDEKGNDPWKEIRAIVDAVCTSLKIAPPPDLTTSEACGAVQWAPTPANDNLGDQPRLLPSAVIGLFPLANQGLLRDTKEMLAQSALAGPVRSFLTLDPDTVQEPSDTITPHAVAARNIAHDRLVSPADPCQASAVSRARTSPVLVIHGPPGTGKSQTITNIIGDALIRGERVLFVCEKRTALDVVANRLTSVGLGDLCAVIHDPQRDQKSLYLSIREQLESLADTAVDPTVAKRVESADRELAAIHSELTQAFHALHTAPTSDEASLHALVGERLTLLADSPDNLASPSLPATAHFTTADIDTHIISIRDVLTRSTEIAYPTNPWRESAGISTDAYFSLPMDRVRAGITSCVQAAAAIDAIPGDLPLPDADYASLSQRLTDISSSFDSRFAKSPSHIRNFWLGVPSTDLSRHGNTIDELRQAGQSLTDVSTVADLIAPLRSAAPTPQACNLALAAIRAYLPIAQSWTRIFAFGKKAAATQALATFGLALAPDNLIRAQSAYAALLAMHSLSDTLTRLGVPAADRAGALDVSLARQLAQDHAGCGSWLVDLHACALPASSEARVRTLAYSNTSQDAASTLLTAAARAKALQHFHSALSATSLLTPKAITTLVQHAAAGQSVSDQVAALESSLDTLDDVLRIREMIAAMPAALGTSVQSFALHSTVAEQGLRLLRIHALAGQISARLASDPAIRQIDAKRISQLFSRFSDLTRQRQGLCQALARTKWIAAQRERLLVGTGSKLNSMGAAIKTRLLVRGSNALRLRQVIQHGAKADGGDPLFDLRPVWMASPETVAQIFPREPLFDVLIFDEASQLKLEEALPVLTRAQRIVIAGDPKQLPPTRFFESSVATSTQNDEAESDADLFESQQARSEDLLSAALSMNVDQSYLDVHYRSRNSDLIEFSNQNFYGGRLQAIPAHPRNYTTVQPLVLYEAGGTCIKSANSAEADQVVAIVRDLLKRADPPSIGIGCFNIVQRDLISERLDEAAEADADFADRYAKALKLTRKGSFEGLFIKNLENVQGDERDHIIISTTYGPDDQGKFRRNFGPLNMPGGGRRLNVLITRARYEIHLVTSIPRSQYASLAPIPPNSAPTGGWLLFAYLHFALQLREGYERSRRTSGTIDTLRDDPALPNTPELHAQATNSPSQLVESLARTLLKTGSHGGTIYWGNNGFAIDHALAHPDPAERLRGMTTLGVQCDFARFALAHDQVEWDIFRSEILEATGWTIQRLWSPALFRDVPGQTRITLKRAEDVVRQSDLTS